MRYALHIGAAHEACELGADLFEGSRHIPCVCPKHRHDGRGAMRRRGRVDTGALHHVDVPAE
jgi:hypothetical protein